MHGIDSLGVYICVLCENMFMDRRVVILRWCVKRMIWDECLFFHAFVEDEEVG